MKRGCRGGDEVEVEARVLGLMKMEGERGQLELRRVANATFG